MKKLVIIVKQNFIVYVGRHACTVSNDKQLHNRLVILLNMLKFEFLVLLSLLCVLLLAFAFILKNFNK